MSRFTISLCSLLAVVALVPRAAVAERQTVTVRSGDPGSVYTDANGAQRDAANSCTHLAWPFNPGDWTGATWVTEDAYVIPTYYPYWADVAGASWISWWPDPYSPGMGYVEDPPHFFTYESGFELPEGAANVTLDLQFTADDWVDVYLNGRKIVDWSAWAIPLVYHQVNPPEGTCSFSCISSITVSDPTLFVAGRNTLRFEQYEPDGAGGIVYLAAASFDPVPPSVQDPVTGNTYTRFDASRNWLDAKAFCEAQGAHLATVTSPRENDLVYGLCSGAAPQWCWLGGSDLAVEGTWQWVTGERFAAYQNWAGGEPNNCSEIEHFLMYFNPPDPRFGTWNDLGSLDDGGQGCGGAAERYRMSTLCEWDHVPVDVRPGGCPNPLVPRAPGTLPVAILGTAGLDVAAIDPASVLVQGVAPVRTSVSDVAAPYEPWFGKVSATACNTAGPDGFQDLVVQVGQAALAAALGPVAAGDVKVVRVTGRLRAEFGGTPFEGEDVVIIRAR